MHRDGLRVGIHAQQLNVPPGPARDRLASSIACVVSGQMVVHCESLKETMTTFPRKERG